MRVHPAALVVCLAIAALTTQPSAQTQPSPAVPVPTVVAADRHDTSPPLRDMPPIPPSGGPTREVPRQSRPTHVGPRAKKFTPDPVGQTYSGSTLMPSATRSFDGVPNVNGVLPPDSNGAVGPNHYVQWVNLSFAIFTKGSSTTPPALVYGPAAGNTLWSGFGGPCETTNNGDVIVIYDHIADRWFMSQLALPNSFGGIINGPFYQCVAVSATPDPTGAYYRYQFQFSKLNDYPKFGLWPDAYYMTMNQYTPISLQFAGQGVVALDRNSMLAGLPASMVYFDLSTVNMNLGGMLPATDDGALPPAGSPDYFVQFDDDSFGYSPDQLEVWQFHVDWSNPSASTFTGPTNLLTAPFDSNMCGYSRTCIPEPGTNAALDALSDRLMYRLQYRNFGDHESLVVNHTVDVDGTDHGGVRWYEVRDPGGAASIAQQGTYAPDADDRWMGSVAMDGAGDLALGFSVSSNSTYPSVRYTGRLAGDTPGTMTQGEAQLVAGGGSQTSSTGRWGDYSSLVVDPVDDCTFWYTQEYYAATSDSGWRTRIGSFAFPSCLSAPTAPTVSIVATTPTATEAGQVPGVFTVSRTGDLSAALTIPYAVTGTATPGSDYLTLPGSVTIPAGASSATITVSPIDDTIVEPNESVVVNLEPPAGYRAGVPSEAIVTIISDDLPPDLIVSALTAPTTGGAGATITVTDTTTNQGSGASPSSQTGFYLSTNLTLDSGDVLLGSRVVAALSPGGSDSASTVLTIPSGTATGTYYVIAMADYQNAVYESQESNNTKFSSAVRVGPDLVVSAASAPSIAAPGGTITVSDTTTNSGGGSAGASTTSFYLSANFGLDSSDPLLGSRPVPALAAGASSSASTTVTIPSNTPAGSYYIIAKADAANVVPETQEQNNTRATFAVKIGPDLVVSSVSTPGIGGAGGSLTISDTTKNQGASTADASTTAFYLSTDLSLTSTDPLLGSRSVPSLAAGTTSSGTTTVQIPPDTVTGTYYILAKADANNQVVESVETNNTAFAAIRIGPDLVVSSLTAPTSAVAGTSITVADTTKNQGGGAAGASTTYYYLSSTLSLTSTGVLLGTRAAAALAAGATDSGSAVVTIPASTTAGTWYVIAAADGANAVVETSETNNTRAFIIKISTP